MLDLAIVGGTVVCADAEGPLDVGGGRGRRRIGDPGDPPQPRTWWLAASEH